MGELQKVLMLFFLSPDEVHGLGLDLLAVLRFFGVVAFFQESPVDHLFLYCFDHLDQFLDVGIVGLGSFGSGTFLIPFELLDVPVFVHSHDVLRNALLLLKVEGHLVDFH